MTETRFLQLPVFTPVAIKNAKRGQTLTEAISPGLRLSVNATTRTFYYRYSGEEYGSRVTRQVRIGQWPAVSIEMARGKWAQLREQRKQGGDPGAEAKAARQQRLQAKRAQRKRLTVEQAIEKYLTEVLAKTRAAKGQYDVRNVLTNHLLERFGSLDVAALTRPKVTAFLTEMASSKPSIALVTRREGRAAWNYLADLGLHDGANPFADQLRGRLKQGKGTRWLTDGEIRQLLGWLPGSGMSDEIQLVLRLMLFTACRSGELVSVEWKHLDLDAATLHLPVTKTGVARTVPLSSQAVALLRGRRKAQPLGERFVFPSYLEDKHIRQHAIVWAIANAREACPVKGWSAHDLRRTTRTGLARLGVVSEVAEACLGHTLGGIQGVYNLHSYADEVRAALQLWSDHIESLTVPNVVPLARTA